MGLGDRENVKTWNKMFFLFLKKIALTTSGKTEIQIVNFIITKFLKWRMIYLYFIFSVHLQIIEIEIGYVSMALIHVNSQF